MASNSIDSFNKKVLKDIENVMKGLPEEFSIRRKRTILKKGLQPFINNAIQRAPKKTGDLKLSIDTKTFRNNPNYVFGGVITKKKIKIGGSVGREEVDAFYAKFIEYGYTHIAWPQKGETIRRSSISRDRLKEIQPKPFLRPAWESTKRQVRSMTIAIASKRVKSYLKRKKKN